ncbi:hypothetical protein QS306_01460 [Paraburkholderia bonniea]|uniref:hypothetical protein n=1 Tax=Paraburkholderia bonniea TaxID=2152891 RepID=UPI00257443DC|nr:hypothetical protein [Paraburkholderia bonniea]WJF90381.1 hypothetical protein QS306_01460 [Paraburkholderia bonniea]WJF93696.1 hypothetical protein QS308_01460 [Paraburkholderia bonniea]
MSNSQVYKKKVSNEKKFKIIMWGAFFTIFFFALTIPDKPSNIWLFSKVYAAGMFFGGVGGYAKISEYPLAFIFSYGGAFWLGWTSSVVIYFIYVGNKEVREKVYSMDQKSRLICLVAFFAVFNLACWPHEEGERVFWMFSMMAKSRIMLGIFSGGVYFINLLASLGFIFVFEYYVRRYLWRR